MSTLPAETRVGRVALRANDPDRLADFYADAIGLTELRATAERAVLGAGDEPLVVLEAAPDAPERNRVETGLFHLAVRVPDRTALADALARIERRWELDGASDHRVSEALYLTDPEGNGVEVYRDRPREAWPTTDDGGVAMDTLPLDLADLRTAGTGAGGGDRGEDGGGGGAGEGGTVGDESDGPPDRARDADSVPPGTDVGHVHLEVSDLADAEAFYVDGLGLGERARYGDAALFLAAGGYHHHVGLNTWNGRSGPGPGRGLAWWELLVPDRATLEAVRQRLDGLEPREGVTERNGTDDEPAAGAVELPDAGFVATDPDGIAVAVRVDRSGTGEAVDRGGAADDTEAVDPEPGRRS